MANKELEMLAKQKGVALPGDDAKMATALPLSNKTGAEFDKEFARIIVEDHEKDIAAFETEASSGSDPDIKRWAIKNLPTLRQHLDEAKALPR
jgi:putative membrane protein